MNLLGRGDEVDQNRRNSTPADSMSTLTMPSEIMMGTTNVSSSGGHGCGGDDLVSSTEHHDDDNDSNTRTSMSITTAGDVDEQRIINLLHSPPGSPTNTQQQKYQHQQKIIMKRRATFTKTIDITSLSSSESGGGGGGIRRFNDSGNISTSNSKLLGSSSLQCAIVSGGKDIRISNSSLPPNGEHHHHPSMSSSSFFPEVGDHKDLQRWSGNTIFAPSRKGRSNNSVTELQINKPRFDRLKLRGRDDEKEILRKCTERTRGNIIIPPPLFQQQSSTSTTITSGIISDSGKTTSTTTATTSLASSSKATTASSSEVPPSPPPPSSSPGLSSLKSAASQTPKAPQVPPKHQLVLISGLSGCGKTALASNVKRNIEKRNNSNYRTNSKRNLLKKQQQQQQQKLPGLYLAGKFDQSIGNQQQQQRPYDAFVQIFQRLVGKILASKFELDEEQEDLQRYDAFLSNFSTMDIEDDLLPLTQTFPELQELLPENIEAQIMKISKRPSSTTNGSMKTESSKAASSTSANRLHQACKRLLDVLATYFCPLVLTLDDLQWADDPSLDLLQTLLIDTKETNETSTSTTTNKKIQNSAAVDKSSSINNTDFSNKLMMIGIYRSDEIQNSRNASNAIQSLRDEAVPSKEEGVSSNDDDESSFEMTEIKVENLSKPDVEEVLGDLFSMDCDNPKIMELADVCIQKTLGNAFFLLTFVKTLYAMDYLEFNFATMGWSWNLEHIRISTVTTENVTDMVKARMVGDLDYGCLLTLKLASCLGAHFPERMLEEVYYNYEDDNGNVDGDDPPQEKNMVFPEVLKILVRENILVTTGESPVYVRWAHDRLQETARSLFSEEKGRAMRKQMGEILLGELNEDEIAASIFILVDLHNDGSTPNAPEERLHLAELNLRGAQRALAMSAMDAAKFYSMKGVDLLPDDKWTNHIGLSLGLYRTACKAEVFLGNHNHVESLSKEVFEQDGVLSLQQQLPIYHEKLMSIESQDGQYQPAIDIYLKILKRMGYKFPKGKGALTWQITCSIFKFKSVPKKLTQEVFGSMESMKDEDMISSMILLDKLASISVMASNPIFLLVADRSFEMTLKHGLCQTSPAVFALIAMTLVIVLGDFENGGKIANYALQTLKKVPNPERIEPRVRYLCHFFVLPWTEPFNSMVKPLLRGYEVGLRIGDVDGAAYCIIMYIIMALLCGRPLEGLSDDCQIYYKQLHDLGRDRVAVFSRVWWQTILNLIGEGGDDPLSLDGKAMTMTEDEYMEFACLPENVKNVRPTVLFLKGFLYTMLGEYRLGADLAVKHGKSIFNDYPSNPVNMGCAYYLGVCLVDAAISTKRRKYKVHAKQMFTRLQGYVKRRNPNAAHYSLGLEAELLVMAGRYNEATMKYQAAVALASRSGFIHDAALLSERFALFLLRSASNQEEEEAVFHLNTAVQLYGEWGAMKKVELLNDKYSKLLLDPVSAIVKVTRSQELLIAHGKSHRQTKKEAARALGGR